jgi:hypothetical protein
LDGGDRRRVGSLADWSVKAEYDYIDFGTKTTPITGTVLPGIVTFPASIGLEDNLRTTGQSGRELSLLVEPLVISRRKPGAVRAARKARRCRKQARLYYKCPPTAQGAIGSTFRSLVESLHQVHVFIPRPTSHSQNYPACLNGIPIPIEGTVGQYFIVPFGTRRCRPKGSNEAGDIPSRAGQAHNEAGADRVGDNHKYDRDRPRLPLQCGGHYSPL